MDFGLTQEQEMLKTWAREFLEAECPKPLVRELEWDERGLSPSLWRKMADLGWQGLVFPERYGGTGMGFQGLALLLEEMGRAILPGPYFSTVVLCGQAILDAGTEEQRETFLGGIAAGELIMALALTEPSAQYHARGITLRAERSGGGYVLNGTKMFVMDGRAAGHFVVVARTSEGADPREGITLLLVEANSPGVTVTPLRVMGIDKQAEVRFDGVEVVSGNLLGQEDGGWPLVERLMAWGAVGKGAESVGGAQGALDLTLEFITSRYAFGHPIASFQAVQHHCADMLTDIETSRYLVYQAAWLVDQGEFHAPEISKAKAWTSDAYRRVTSLANQCHGGMALMRERDVHFYHKRAKVNEVLFGDAAFHWERLVAALEA